MNDSYPKHIGIILDGNRRWAKARGMKPWDGHDKGFDKLKELIRFRPELNIKELSLYCFSMQNFNRDKLEVDFLMNIFVKAAKQVLDDEDVHKNKMKIRFIGRLGLLPEKVQKAAKEVAEATKDYDNHIVNFCVAYGGQEEIVDGVNRAIADAKAGKIGKVDEKSFGKYLYINSPPDIIIRTSGEQRLSNFLTWHSTYSELFFIQKHWPDFSKEDLKKIIDEFVEKRNRRFGN
jgi:tritrans,polycis-undecaprenyl-diphosphate synthase [geranylgeranyl-diphosphate specific]